MTLIPPYIYKKSNQITQICFVAVFALLFILLYHPLDLEDLNLTILQNWGWPAKAISLTLTATVIIIGVGVVMLSRAIMNLYTRKHSMSYLVYIIWIAAEVVIMASVYTCGSYLNDSTRPLGILFQESLYKTILVILIPYILSYVYIIWQEQARKLKAIRHELESGRDSNDPYIQVLDERGEMRLSIKRENLLYIAAEDNYVCVSYLAGNNVKNIMVRNTLKRVAEQLDSDKIMRCHRSYLVNIDHIKVLRREKDGFYIEMGIDKVPDIPISKTYGEALTSKIMKF